jgi:hypothetical protein
MIGPNNNWMDSRQAQCVAEGLKEAAEDVLMFKETHAVADALADGSLKPLKALVSPEAAAGAAAGTAKQGAEHIAENRSVQKAIKGALRSIGTKTSANAVGRAAKFSGKAAGAIGIILSVNTAYEGYSTCMAN